jgi:cholesterol transport system auxiliary component
MNRNFVPIAAVLAGCTLLAACSGLRSAAKADQIYVLHAAPAATGTPLPAVLAVPRPAANPGLDTDRIALLRAGNELDYYAASHYGETLTRVLGVLAVQSLAGGEGFVTTLSSDRAAVHSDYDLLLTVRRFEADYSGDKMLPVVQVAIDCLLIATAPRGVLGSCDGAAAEPVGANRMSEIVAALERATQRALADVRSKAVALARATPPPVLPKK